MLDIENLYAGYAEVPILQGADLQLRNEDMGVIVGPNGAGKSTLLKAIFGLLPIRQGRVLWNDQDVTQWKAEERVFHGMVYVPQENNIFSDLTVMENLEMGAYSRRDNLTGTIDQIFNFFPPLKEKVKEKAGLLSGGQRQMVAIGRALMVEPKLILLDEPTVGLSPLYMNEMLKHIRKIHQSGVGILMVEQNAKQALEVADVGFVFVGGKRSFSGNSKELLANPDVAQAFLGG